MPAFLERKLRAEYGNNPHAIYGTMNFESGPFDDDELVKVATRKINMLKKMLLATGLNERMLKAVMEE